MQIEACEKADIESLQRRSRGSYGGGDLLRPRKGHRTGAADSSMLKSSSFFSMLLLRCVLVLVFVILVWMASKQKSEKKG